eukprot:TRINITY_DN3618_c0_g1_i1.p1 TRINITY_DN3618_c0_g1~~TRINITY_DN3618_c0_g1_i1.p1  ORF type:complete len:331 (-),score=-12.65 TRINITY_DN3618_c0_g1_i1:42-1004(-)
MANVTRAAHQRGLARKAADGKARIALMHMYVNNVGVLCMLWQRFRKCLDSSDVRQSISRVLVQAVTDAEKGLLIFKILRHRLRFIPSVKMCWASPGGRYIRSQAPPVLLGWAKAILHPDLPYELEISHKGAGLKIKEDCRLSLKELRDLGLSGFIEILDPVTMEHADTIGYPGLISSSGYDGILFGPIALLNEADKGVRNTFTIKNVTTSHVDCTPTAEASDRGQDMPARRISVRLHKMRINTRSHGPCEDLSSLEAAAEAARAGRTRRCRMAVPSRGITQARRAHKEVFLGHTSACVLLKAGCEITVCYGRSYRRRGYL